MSEDSTDRDDDDRPSEEPLDHAVPLLETGGPSHRPIDLRERRIVSKQTSEAGPRKRRGQLRVLDDRGQPVGGVPLTIRATSTDGEVNSVQATPGPTGYATFDLDAIDLDRTESVTVEPVTGGGSSDIDPQTLGDIGASVVNLGSVRDSFDLSDAFLEGLDDQPFMLPPDINDVESAPELFNPKVVRENGNCSIDFTAKVDVHENFFNQLVRMTPERVELPHRPTAHGDDLPTARVLDGQLPFPLTTDYPNEEAEEGEVPYLEHASRPTLGTMNVYKQSWTRVGHSVGKLLHSLTLAPCESTEVAIVEWSRTERGRRRERTRAVERLTHELHRDRMIEEIVEGMVKEDQWGSSTSVQGGTGASGGLAGFVGSALGAVGMSIGGGAAHSSSDSHGRRSLQASTLQNLSDSVVQGASNMRSLRSSVVTQSQEIERDEVRTRAVENHNRNHAMTVEYFQVLEHYNVHSELVDETEVLMIPYDVPLELWDDVPDFDSFIVSQSEVNALLGALASSVAGDLTSILTATGRDEIGDAMFADEEEMAADSVEGAIVAAGQDLFSEASDVHLGGEDPGELAAEAWTALMNRVEGSESILGNVDVRPEHFSRRKFFEVLTQEADEIFDRVDPRSESALIGWLDRNSERLRSIVPARHGPAFDALYRLVHTPEVYEADRPTVTASSWTVELREAWRPGVTLLVHTADGQTIELDRDGGTSGSAVASFSSPPVDVAAIAAIEINFAPETATKTVVKSVGETVDDLGDALGEVGEFFTGQDTAPFTEEVEEARKFDIGRIRVTAHTDPMPALPQTKSYELIDETEVGTTLTADDPAERWSGITVPEPDILETETRRYDDYSEVESLITHVQSNRMAYLRRLWLGEDPDKRALRFQQYSYPIQRNGSIDYVPLLDLIENEPLGVVGNSVAFRLLEQGQLDAYEEVSSDDLSTSNLVSLPTRGVYAETLLSHCNATEIRDVDRIPTERSRCRTEAPAITGVTPGSRQSPPQLEPTVPESTLGIQQPPAAPAPTGLSEALQVLSTPGIFRDMSLGASTVQAANALATKALEESGQARQQTLEALYSMLGSATEGDSGDQSAEEATIEAAREAVRRSRQAAEHQATQAHRQSDPVRNRDHQQNLDQARQRGAISEDAYQEGSERLHNADETDTVREAQARGSGVISEAEQNRLFTRARGWKQAIRENAVNEEGDWTDEDGNKIDEGEKLATLKAYYAAVYDDQDTIDTKAQEARDDTDPWSAAFISYVVEQAGISRSDGFELSFRHLNYIVHALRNRRNYETDGASWLYSRPVWLYAPDEIDPEEGDILCKNRGGPPTFDIDMLANRFLVERNGRYEIDGPIRGGSHCDVVVKTEEVNGQQFIETVGGNTYDFEDEVFDTVGRKRWKNASDGWVMVDDGGTELDDKVVDGTDVWDPDTDSVFGFIRVKTWAMLTEGDEPI